MKHIVALLIKYTAITAVLLIMLSIFQGISIPRVLLTFFLRESPI